MPMRREEDRVEEIESFDEWVHDRLEEAIARGEFDNLPQKGKPIRIETNPYQPELDLAFSRLKNAGLAPAWIEFDREILRMHEALDQWLRASADRLAVEAARIRQLDEAPAPARSDRARPWHQRWWPFALFTVEPVSDVDPRTEWQRWDFVRRRDRQQYLERARQLDARIQLFNDSIPRNLWHLEKMRLVPAKAADRFDAAVPPR
jgi:hypothetical protein